MSATERPDITAVFLLYNAAPNVPALVRGLLEQTDPQCPKQSEWLRAIFVDDQSRDDTVRVLRQELDRAGQPAHYHVIANPENLGLAGTLNKALRQVRTEFALTCHCDVFFGRRDYIAAMRDLLRRHLDAGIITGRPEIAASEALPFVEKVNIVANLMDVIPELPREGVSAGASAQAEVRPIAFAEGKCDGLRLSALKEVGFYPTALRTSGEDQLLAAALRDRGYRVLQAPALTYTLRLSDEQNTIGKLIRHQRLFARTQPFILFRGRGTFGAGASAGTNLRSRALLRVMQLTAVVLYLTTAVLLAAGAPVLVWIAPLAAVFAGRAVLSLRHLRLVRPAPLELAGIWAVQPVLDIVYALGFVQGVGLALRPGPRGIR